MKVLALCVILFVAAIGALPAAIKYAGTTSGSAMFSPPTWDSAGACTAQTFQAPYVVFNATFSSAGVWEVAAMAENAFKSSLRVYVYSSFVPTQPCASTVSHELTKQIGLSGGPVVDDYVYFVPGTYYFVVTGTSETAAGIFAINIFPSVASGTTMGATRWPVAYNSSGACYVYGGSDPESWVPYATFSWLHTDGTGYFDLYATFVNNSIDFSYTYAALFEGTVSSAMNLSDPCNSTATGGTWKYGYYGSSKAALLPYQQLTNGTTYTFLLSGSTVDEYGWYGVQVIPTRIRFLTFNPAWTQPQRHTDPVACAEDTGYSNLPWSSTVFTAENRAYLLDTQDVPDPFTYFDTYSFMYAGWNAGTGATAPSSCPLAVPLVSDGDTGDVTPVYSFTTPGLNYTVVVSSYSSSLSENPNYAYILHLFTGDPIGTLPSVTTGAQTSTGAVATTGGSATTGTVGGATTVSGTSATTKAASVTTGGGSSTTGAATTSSAASLFVSFALCVAMVLALVM